MSKHNTPKYDIVRKVLKETPVESSSGGTFRQRCIDTLVNVYKFPKNGASTYFSTIAAEMGLTSSRGNRSSSIDRPFTAKECASEIDLSGLVRVPMNLEIYSMVTCDARRVAIDVRCFNDKQQCLDMCNKLNKHFVRGLQRVGAFLNVIDEPGKTRRMLAQAQAAEMANEDDDDVDLDVEFSNSVFCN